MRLSDLDKYNNIVIQCHDNPDADAIGCGFALYSFLKSIGKDVRFIYRGRNRITKSNLVIMLKELEIPIEYEPEFEEMPELLINVDCQFGQRNVTDTEAKVHAVIDHHKVSGVLPDLSEVRSAIGSCATVIWSMLKDEGYEPNDSQKIATALYYGLYTDTNKLSEMAHPLDRDMIDDLTSVDMSLIRLMSNSNISLEELKITGNAILGYKYLEDHAALIIEADPCDPNILGVISDFALETDKVDVTVAYYVGLKEIKFSVRSCTKTVHANDLAAFIADNIGGAGGHMNKAGGVIWPDKVDGDAGELFEKRLTEYSSLYEIMYAKDTTLDRDSMKLYSKREQELGTVRLTDIFPEKTHITLRTLEGDINTVIEGDTYLMIGIEGEIYPIKEEKLKRSYRFSDKPYTANFDYQPTVKNSVTGDKKSVIEFAHTVISSGGARIYARPLTRAVKLFTQWDNERYYLGNIGDYIAVREDDPHDIYVVNGGLFDKLYQECD